MEVSVRRFAMVLAVIVAPTRFGEFRDMLVTVRDRVAALKKQGKSLDEIISAKPTDAFDSKWGESLLDGALFTRLVYAGA
jgi:hypothetical protein